MANDIRKDLKISIESPFGDAAYALAQQESGIFTSMHSTSKGILYKKLNDIKIPHRTMGNFVCPL